MSEAPVWDGTGMPPAPAAAPKKAKDSEPKATEKKEPQVKAPAKAAKSKPTEE